jgi:hypothetical protein
LLLAVRPLRSPAPTRVGPGVEGPQTCDVEFSGRAPSPPIGAGAGTRGQKSDMGAASSTSKRPVSLPSLVCFLRHSYPGWPQATPQPAAARDAQSDIGNDRGPIGRSGPRFGVRSAGSAVGTNVPLAGLSHGAGRSRHRPVVCRRHTAALPRSKERRHGDRGRRSALTSWCGRYPRPRF